MTCMQVAGHPRVGQSTRILSMKLETDFLIPFTYTLKYGKTYL